MLSVFFFWIPSSFSPFNSAGVSLFVSSRGNQSQSLPPPPSLVPSSIYFPPSFTSFSNGFFYFLHPKAAHFRRRRRPPPPPSPPRPFGPPRPFSPTPHTCTHYSHSFFTIRRDAAEHRKDDDDDDVLRSTSTTSIESPSLARPCLQWLADSRSSDIVLLSVAVAPLSAFSTRTDSDSS